MTGAKNRAETIELSSDTLTTSMDFYFEDRRLVPLPSASKRGQVAVDHTPSVVVKDLLLNEMIR